MRCNDLTGWEGVSAIYAQLLLDWGIILPPEALAAMTASQQEAEIRAQALRGRLAVTDPALVLLDNVERDLPLREVLATLASLHMTVLVTTRTFFNLPQLRSHRLDVLKPEEAQRLLRERYVAKEGDWDDARDPVPSHSVVAALGHLPLAIELAAARAGRLKLSIARLDRELHEPDALAKLNDPTDPTAGVQYIIGRTLDLLSPSEHTCFAALGQVAAVDYPQAVVLTLFTALLDSDDPDAPAQAVDLLITLSLVMPDDVGGIMRLRLHPLLHELASKQWQTQHDMEVQAAGRAGLLKGLNVFAREHQRDFATLSQDETLYMDALHMAEQHGVDWDAIIDLIWAIDDYLDLQGRWKLYEETLHLRLRAYRELGNRAGEGQVLGNLGSLAAEQGRYVEAAEYYAQSLAILEPIGYASASIFQRNLARLQKLMEEQHNESHKGEAQRTRRFQWPWSRKR